MTISIRSRPYCNMQKKLDSEEEGSIHSAMSEEENEKEEEEKEEGVEPVKLSIIV